jgi:ribonuclease E
LRHEAAAHLSASTDAATTAPRDTDHHEPAPAVEVNAAVALNGSSRPTEYSEHAVSTAPIELPAPEEIAGAKAHDEPTAIVHAIASTPIEHGVGAAAAANLSLEQTLAAAGLMMATTDPEKLRRAQEATASIGQVARTPRERKPVPPSSEEPLVQIETRN